MLTKVVKYANFGSNIRILAKMFPDKLIRPNPKTSGLLAAGLPKFLLSNEQTDILRREDFVSVMKLKVMQPVRGILGNDVDSKILIKF